MKDADTLTAMLDDKMRAVLATDTEIVTPGDSSCLMHIEGGLTRLQTGVRPMHLAQILASAEGPPFDFLGMPRAGHLSPPTDRTIGHPTGDRSFPAAARDSLAATSVPGRRSVQRGRSVCRGVS